jgi:hypothetical protein
VEPSPGGFLKVFNRNIKARNEPAEQLWVGQHSSL